MNKWSFWLLPPANERKMFAQVIQQLAKRLGTVGFAPHITLANCMGDEAHATTRARQLAEKLKPLPIAFKDIGHGEQYFQCLYARVETTPAMIDAHRLAAEHGGVPPLTSFMPHLSLVYGFLPAPKRKELTITLTTLTKTKFTANELVVCEVGDDPSTWRVIGPFPLTG